MGAGGVRVPPLDVRSVLCRVVWSVFLVALNFQFQSRSRNVTFSRYRSSGFTSYFTLTPADTFEAEYDYSIDYGTDNGGIDRQKN